MVDCPRILNFKNSMRLNKWSILPVALALLIVALIPANGGILIGSLSTVTTAQTNSATFQTNTAQINLPQVSVSNNNLAITNAYSGYFRWSFDGVTFYTNASPVFIPSTTNAGTATIPQQTITVPIMVQMVAITNTANTSTIQLGVTSP